MAKGEIKPLSDVDFAVFLDESVNPIDARLEVLGVATAHLETDEVDLVVLNTAPTALVGRMLQARRVICDREPFVERTLQMAIEVCVDIATHVIADRGFRVPATYAEAFEVLGEAGLLDPGMQEAMVRMAKFRNVIVHEYTRVDPGIDDVARFRTAALDWQ